VLSAFSPIDGGFFKYTPLRLPAYALSFIMEDVATGDLIWTIVIGLGLSVFLSVLGIFLFNKQLYKQ
jgi:hypothetical protein